MFLYGDWKRNCLPLKIFAILWIVDRVISHHGIRHQIENILIQVQTTACFPLKTTMPPTVSSAFIAELYLDGASTVTYLPLIQSTHLKPCKSAATITCITAWWRNIQTLNVKTAAWFLRTRLNVQTDRKSTGCVDGVILHTWHWCDSCEVDTKSACCSPSTSLPQH